jgi:hypothetical protein
MIYLPLIVYLVLTFGGVVQALVPLLAKGN